MCVGVGGMLCCVHIGCVDCLSGRVTSPAPCVPHHTDRPITHHPCPLLTWPRLTMPRHHQIRQERHPAHRARARDRAAVVHRAADADDGGGRGVRGEVLPALAHRARQARLVLGHADGRVAPDGRDMSCWAGVLHADGLGARGACGEEEVYLRGAYPVSRTPYLVFRTGCAWAGR